MIEPEKLGLAGVEKPGCQRRGEAVRAMVTVVQNERLGIVRVGFDQQIEWRESFHGGLDSIQICYIFYSSSRHRLRGGNLAQSLFIHSWRLATRNQVPLVDDHGGHRLNALPGIERLLLSHL